MKSMRNYLSGQECGNIIKAQWVDDRLLETEREEDEEPKGVNSMELGSYFEFILTKLLTGTGSLPKSQLVPRPRFYSGIQKTFDKLDEKGKDNFLFNPEADNVLLAPYKLAHVNAHRVVGYFKQMGLKCVAAGRKYALAGHEITVDLEMEMTKKIPGIKFKKGQVIVIDVKYSGLIGERGKWNVHGWQWTTDQKKYHGTQAIHYHMVIRLPFFFLPVSSKNETDVKLFYIPVNQEMITDHCDEAADLLKSFKLHVDIGLVPRPEVSKCARCPLFSECKDKHTFPHPETIDLTI